MSKRLKKRDAESAQQLRRWFSQPVEFPRPGARLKRRDLEPANWIMQWARTPWESLPAEQRDRESLCAILAKWWGYTYKDAVDFHRLHQEAGALVRFAWGEVGASAVHIAPLAQIGGHEIKAFEQAGRRGILVGEIFGAGLRECVMLNLARCFAAQSELPLPRCPVCTATFIRRDRFQKRCSARCTSRATTSEYRQKHLQDHRRRSAIAMRKLYKKKLKKKFGDNVQIQRRTRKYL